jgi:peptidoglycan/LPS O-acetylase OafA/YrhL
MDFRALPREIDSARMHTALESGPDAGRLAAPMSMPFTRPAPTTNAAGLAGQAAVVPAAATRAGHASTEADANPPETRERSRRPDIQGLRAVAVLMVVAFHAGLPVPGGFVGVDVFFVISGFVIAGMLLRERRATGRIRFGRFYLRRFKRLTPALALMVAVTMIISVAVLSPLGTQQTAAKTGIGAMLLVANAVIARTTGGYFDADAATNPLLHTWTLSVEEQFYLAFPALIALGWYIASRRRSLRFTPHVFVVSIAVVSFGLASFGLAVLSSVAQPRAWLLGSYGPATEAVLGFYSPATRSWEFALGVLLAMGAQRLTILSRRITLALGFVGAGMLTASLWVISGTTPFPSAWTLIPVIGTLLVLAAGTGATNPVTRALAVDPMVKIGDWSYSIYLWHWPFIVFARALWPDSRPALLIAAAVSFIPALASYRWLEKPIRNLQGLRGWRVVRVVSITLFVPLFVSASTYLAANRGYWSPGIRAMQDAVLQPSAMGRGECSAATNLVSRVPIYSCVWNAAAGGKPIYVVGDSTAWVLSDAAFGASRLLGRPLTMISTLGCPFRDVFIQVPNLPSYRSQEACRQMYESTMRWLGEQPSGTVVTSELNDWYRKTDAAVGRESQALTTNPARRTQALDDGLTFTIVTLKHAGHSVLLVQTPPDFEYPVKFDPLRCTWSELRADTCIARLPRSVADSIQQVERSSLQRIATQTGAGLFDPRDFFCSSDECSTQGHGIDLYRDAFHISANASRMLAPSLAGALNRLP